MTDKDFNLKKLSIPHVALENLSRAERYSVLMLGHIFNEVMTLQRLAVTLKPTPKATDTEKAGSLSQVALILRLLSGKIYEAQLRINSKEISEFLRVRCFPLMEAGVGAENLKKFNVTASQCKWLNPARNRHALHYPDMHDWKPALDLASEHEFPFELIAGDRDGEVLFHTADTIANLAFFLEADRLDWSAGFDAMLTDLHMLNKLLSGVSAEPLQAFVLQFSDAKPFNKRLKIKDVKRFDRVAFDQVCIPFFYHY
jgi:hypothetical protein